MNADHMIDDTTPRINAAERAQRHARMDQAKRDGALDWAEWWQLAAADPVLAEPTARRFEIYGEHADGDMPPVAWHARVLREKGLRRGPARCGAPLGHCCCSPSVDRRRARRTEAVRQDRGGTEVVPPLVRPPRKGGRHDG